MDSNKHAEEAAILNQLKSQEWFNYTGYLNIDKIKENIPSYSYLFNSINNLENYCTKGVWEHVMSKPNLLKSKNAKELARHGVPPKYLKDFIMKLCFTTEIDKENYTYFLGNALHNFRVEDMDEYVPYFSGRKTLKESLPVHYLNEEGIFALKEILWILKNDCPFIDFSPNIIGLVSVLLLFLKKEEAFKATRALIKGNYSFTEIGNIRFHFRFNYDDNAKIVSSLQNAMTEISTKTGRGLNEHFHKINFATELLYEDMIFNFLLKHLNFFGMIKFLPFFLMEGTKSMYRLVYALVKATKENLENIEKADEVLESAEKIMKKIEDYDQLFEVAYSFGLTRSNNAYEIQENPQFGNSKALKLNYYLPKFPKKSSIIKDKDIIQLWSHFPPELISRDSNKVYDSSTDGYALSTVIELKNKVSEGNYLMMIIENDEDEVFGLIISGVFNLTERKFIRPSLSLLLHKDGNMKIYSPEDGAEDVLYIDTECLMFGNGKDGPALRIDKDFNIGHSNKGGCFNNPCLVKDESGQFKIKKFEIYELVM